MFTRRAGRVAAARVWVYVLFEFIYMSLFPEHNHWQSTVNKIPEEKITPDQGRLVVETLAWPLNHFCQKDDYDDHDWETITWVAMADY